MIKRYKSDRIIILTTHYMDEADVLGDRICIMAEGEVQCCGSALFLKNRFGVGYRLSLIKSANTCADDVQRWLIKHMEKAIFVQDLHSEMIYQIP
jgi:ABC-type multidrug transport system ATPase subunit